MKLHRANDSDGRLMGYSFVCPGCGCMHVVYTEKPPEGRKWPVWEYSGDVNRPTFRPSILVRGVRPITDEEHARIMRGEKVEPVPMVCHSYVTDGVIEFLSDCTHELVGKKVELPDRTDD